jgi:hypothetical protein
MTCPLPERQRPCYLLLQDLAESRAWEGEEDSGRHVLWDTTSRGLCGLVLPPRTGSSGPSGLCSLALANVDEGSHTSVCTSVIHRAQHGYACIKTALFICIGMHIQNCALPLEATTDSRERESSF